MSIGLFRCVSFLSKALQAENEDLVRLYALGQVPVAKSKVNAAPIDPSQLQLTPHFHSGCKISTRKDQRPFVHHFNRSQSFARMSTVFSVMKALSRNSCGALRRWATHHRHRFIFNKTSWI